MHRVFSILLFAALCGSSPLALAQREAPPSPNETEAAPSEAPPSPAAPDGAAAPPPEPGSASSADTHAETPPPSAAPAQRFEGEVDGDENAPAYDEDLGKEDDNPETPRSHHASYPGFSVRIDPFNWLIEGRLGLELEMVAWKFISIEAVPVFIVNDTPPVFNLSGRDDPISQHSHGLGPIAGTSIGAGFWLSGTPLNGYVLRAIFTNYALTYKASDSSGSFDRVSHTERRIVAYVGSHTRFGFFTLAGGIGLGYELNQQQRCIVNRGAADVMASTSGCPDSGELQIKLDPLGKSVGNLNGGFHPVYLMVRFSLGVTFD